ncbi:DUF2344 domain-containing protein [Pseudonocardiaceae bacterium YIM PH 21723]|nr:DUF2344 domain-containing protein [Pseudonocardiaceae bacterium YIM PH 21723]
MQKIRLRYTKRGRLRFASHRDVARAFERALRRAGVPMAYSQGFNPKPKVSWVGATPTGVASEAEYVEISVVRELPTELLRQELNNALPPGLDVLEAVGVPVGAGGGSLPDRIEAGEWRIEVPGVTEDQLAVAVEKLLAADRVEVERLTKDGKRTIDARAAVVSAAVTRTSEKQDCLAAQDAQPATQRHECPGLAGPYGILTVVVRQTSPAVRPDDVLNALCAVASLELPAPARATRLAQGRLDESSGKAGFGGLVDPLAADRVTASPIGQGSEPENGAGCDTSS